MSLGDYKIIVSLGVSVLVLYLVLHSLAVFVSNFFGWDYFVTFVLLFVGICVGAFLFGFFLLPGGEWVWKKKGDGVGE